MQKIFMLLLLFNSIFIFSQSSDSISNIYKSTVNKMLEEKPGLTLGGYGEVHYNQPMNGNVKESGTLDVHRIVMFLGYNFSSKTQFVTEIEFEYAKELWVEQAFIQHQFNPHLNFRAGLLLIPMGIINEYHEPTTFNGVERPIIDNKISPTTWREVGLGFTGNIYQAYLKYQAYIVGGFNGYDASGGLFSGSKTLREGRQKGSKAYVTSPNFAGKIEFYGFRNLNIGLSGYFGKSQSKLYHNISKDSTHLIRRADSSVVNISMLGADVRYGFSGIKITGQFYYTFLGNTREYNIFTAKNNVYNDLGKAMMGYYFEVGYNILQPFDNIKSQLIPFVRYEAYNTHQAVEDIITINEKYNNTIITTGLTYVLTRGVVLKSDLQFMKSKADNKYQKIFNAGIGVMF